MVTRLERFQGALIGTRIGDSMGLPWETMTPKAIRKITGPEGITTFVSPQQRSDAPAWARKLASLKPGDHSDDWQMTRAGAKSLIRCRELNLEDLARAYIDEMNACHLGWGGTTKHGLREIERWFKSSGREGRRPGDFCQPSLNPKPGTGAGNGVAMRIAPIGLWWSWIFWVRDNTPLLAGHFSKEVWEVGGLTHPHPLASFGAHIIATTIARLASQDGPPIEGRDLLRMCGDIGMRDLLGMEVGFTPEVGFVPMEYPLARTSIFYRFMRVVLGQAFGSSDEDPVTHPGTSSYVMDSVPFAITTFLRHPTDFRAALKEAVEAGGDTDTNAAIVGSLVGANVGIEGIPQEWRTFREDFNEATELGIGLWETVQATIAANRNKENQ
mgnify:CR=1 FL=1